MAYLTCSPAIDFDDAHRRHVAIAETGLQHAGIAALAVLVARAEDDVVVRQPLVFNDHIEYVEGLVSTPEMRACVSRRMLESFSGQYTLPNSCEVEQLNDRINQNGTSIRGLVKSLTQLESIRLRTQ